MDANHLIPEAVLVAGSRPEAVKLAPLARSVAQAGRLRSRMVVASQHPPVVHEALEAFDVKAETEVHIGHCGGIAELAVEVVAGLDRVLGDRPPAVVVVQGAATTAVMAAQVACWREIPLVHLEAGLRAPDPGLPHPEDANRRIIDQLAALHLAPTARAAANLLAEGFASHTVCTIGTTVVDAVRAISATDIACDDRSLEAVVQRARRGEHRLVLVTTDRRESWGEPLDQVLRAVADLVTRHDDLEVVLPVHPNPQLRGQVWRRLGGVPRVTLTEVVPYPDLVRLLAAATLVLSDSDDIQEVAPTVGVPVLLLRSITERMEGVKAGCSLLVGTDRSLITATAGELLTNEPARAAMAGAGNPFGDGYAARRGEQALAWLAGLDSHRPDEFGTPGEPSARSAA